MQLAILTQERDEILTEIDNANTVLNPIRVCPAEILQRIFLECVHDISFTTSSHSLEPTWMPWILSRVSSRWRQLAISFPKLWAQVAINNPNPHVESSLHHLVAQLYRASRHPLIVTITCHSVRDIDPLFPILCGSAPSWEHLTVSHDANILSRMSATVGSLTSLEVVCIQRLRNIPTSPPDLFYLCGKLQRFTGPLKIINTIQLPWSQLRTLSIHVLPPGDQTVIIPPGLQVATNLHRLSFRQAPKDARGSGAGPQSNHQPSTVRVFCKTIKLDVRLKEHWPIFARLRFPSLIKLELFLNFRSVDAPLLGQLLRDSNCHIEELIFKEVGCTDAEMLDILRLDACQTLRQLKLSPFDVDGAISTSLSSTSHPPSALFLPALTRFSPGIKPEAVTRVRTLGQYLSAVRPGFILRYNTTS
jgi:hypothetical protein